MDKNRKRIRRFSACMALVMAAGCLSGISVSAAKPVINETSYYLEAEDGKLYGTAEVKEEKAASGGKYVSELNFNHGKYDTTNKLALSLKKVKYPGRYKVSLYYSSGTNGQVLLAANGRKQSVAYKSTGGWEWNRSATSGIIELKGNGKDRLVIADGPEGFIWLDAVRLTYMGSVSKTNNPTKKNRYEAEDAVGGKLVYTRNHQDASGGAYVHELNFAGVGSNKQGYVKFNKLKIKKAGTYKMTLHFSSASDGRAYAWVNNNKYPYYKNYKSSHLGNWGVWKDQAITMKVYLRGNGKDTIRIHDRVGYMWLDYMTLKYVSSKKISPKAFEDKDDESSSEEQVNYTVKKEAEEAMLTKEVNVASEAKASGGAYINNLNYSADASRQGSATFKDLGAAEAGAYRLRMAFNSAAEGKIWVIVNDSKKAYEAGYTSSHNGDWGTWITQFLTIDIQLTGKDDTITIYNREGYMWLDYIELGRLSSSSSGVAGGSASAPAVSGSSGSGSTVSDTTATLDNYNGGFEASHKYWTFVGDHAGINSDDSYYKAKVYFYAPGAFEQSMYETVTVPDGYYYVQAKTKQSLGTPEICQLQVSEYDGGAVTAADISKSNAYITTQTDVFQVKDGKMKITFYEKAAEEANLQIDNVVIVSLGEEPPASAEEKVNHMEGYNGSFDLSSETAADLYALGATEWEFAEAALWADHQKNGQEPEIFTLGAADHIRLSRGSEWVWIDWIELTNTEDQTVYHVEAEDYVWMDSGAFIREGNGATYVYSEYAGDCLAEISTADAGIPEGQYTMKLRYLHQGSDSGVQVTTDAAAEDRNNITFDSWESTYGACTGEAAGGAVDLGRYAVLTSNGDEVTLSQSRTGFEPGSTYRIGAWVKAIEYAGGTFTLNDTTVSPEADWTYVEAAGVVSNRGRLAVTFRLNGDGERAAVAIDEVVLYGELGEYHPQTYHFEAENYAVSKVGETGEGVKYAQADNEHDPLVTIPLTEVEEGVYTVKIHYSYKGNDTWASLEAGSSSRWYQIPGSSQTDYDVFDDYTFTADGAAVEISLSETDTLTICRGGEWIWIDYIELIPQAAS